MTERKDWYSPSEITFSQRQIIWLIEHLPLLRDGFWPPEHKETGYIDSKGRQVANQGYFIKAALVAAELDIRIERAGLDGLLLEFIHSFSTEDKKELAYHMAKILSTDLTAIDKRLKKALRYIRGKGRKDVEYRYFRSHHRRPAEGFITF